MTICDSFKMAKKKCEVRYGPNEASKFIILTQKKSIREIADESIPKV